MWKIVIQTLYGQEKLGQNNLLLEKGDQTLSALQYYNNLYIQKGNSSCSII